MPTLKLFCWNFQENGRWCGIFKAMIWPKQWYSTDKLIHLFNRKAGKSPYFYYTHSKRWRIKSNLPLQTIVSLWRECVLYQAITKIASQMLMLRFYSLRSGYSREWNCYWMFSECIVRCYIFLVHDVLMELKWHPLQSTDFVTGFVQKYVLI